MRATVMLERRLYSTRPPRHEYVLTPMGSEFVSGLSISADPVRL
jgi:DNA-binding HxlR family transcriptional regulator